MTITRARTAVARLHWNENPLGPPPAAVARLRAAAAEAHRYPVALRAEATHAFARAVGLAPEQVLLTCGVDEATDLVLARARRACIVEPGFDGYRQRAEATGVPVLSMELDAEWQPRFDPGVLEVHDVVLLAQPHNPTGSRFSVDWLRQVMTGPARTVIDETYVDFSAGPSAVPDLAEHPRLLVFRSFSKSYGLAGLRLGALLGTPAAIAGLASRQCFHSVDSLALHGLLGALEDPDHLERVVAFVRAGRVALADLLRMSDRVDRVVVTETNFVLASCRTGATATDLTQALAEHDVLITDCARFGMPGWLRVSTGTPADLERLGAAVLATNA